VTAPEPVGHWTHVEHSRRGLGDGPWYRATRAVCQCGWRSSWYFSGLVAVEAGLAHSAAPAVPEQS
jgi:hypothetical protein